MEKNAIKVGFPEFPVAAVAHARSEAYCSHMIITNSSPSGSILFRKNRFPASRHHRK